MSEGFKLRNVIPKPVVDKIRSVFRFPGTKGAVHEWGQSPGVRSDIGPERMKGYRYPAPGSHRPAFVPLRSEERIYNTQYYTRDTARNNFPPVVGRHPSVQIAKEFKQLDNEEVKQIGSPGSKNPAVLRYDPSGTITSMTANWAGMNSELAKSEPNHLVVESWLKEADSIVQFSEENGLPPLPGAPVKVQLPQTYYEYRW